MLVEISSCCCFELRMIQLDAMCAIYCSRLIDQMNVAFYIMEQDEPPQHLSQLHELQPEQHGHVVASKHVPSAQHCHSLMH